MAVPEANREPRSVEFSWSEAAGAIGDSVTVLPVVAAVAVLTELSLAVMLLWFGAFQVVWGLYYGAPVSVEPMKALAALVIAGTIGAGEMALAGLFLGVVLLTVGATDSLARVGRHVEASVVRGVQFGVAGLLAVTGLGLAAGDPLVAAVGAAVAVAAVAAGYRSLSAVGVLLVGAGAAVLSTGLPAPALPSADALVVAEAPRLTRPAAEAALAQLAMTVGNAALATSLLLGEYFDREVSPDELAASMGAMNLVAVPFGAFPMCHGSGGVAGKYAFGARTAGANVLLGVGYAAVAVLGVGLVAAFPMAVLGVLLVAVAAQLGYTSLERADERLTVVGLGVLGVVVNLGAALLVGVAVSLARRRLA